MYIDTHCHLNDKKLIDNFDSIVSDFEKDGVDLAICNSSERQDFEQLLQLSQTNKKIYCTLGVHPHTADTYNVEVEKYILQNANNSKVVAIGEIGLDYYYDFCDRELQKHVMLDQIKLANQLKLPIVFHVRDAMGEFLEIVRQNRELFGYGAEVHSFSGSLEVAKELISYGFYLGFNGIITFKNANKILDVIKNISIESILLETDAPYLTPEPFRGQVNQPKYTNLVAKKIAQIKNIELDKVYQITSNNAYNLFKKLRKD